LHTLYNITGAIKRENGPGFRRDRPLGKERKGVSFY